MDRTYTTPGQNRGVCCGVVNRGVALYGDAVLAPVLDGRGKSAGVLISLDDVRQLEQNKIVLGKEKEKEES